MCAKLKDACKNPLWQNFVAIFKEVDDDKNVVILFVGYVKCSSVMSYDGAKGTTGWPLFWKTWKTWKSQGIQKLSGKSQGK